MLFDCFFLIKVIFYFFFLNDKKKLMMKGKVLFFYFVFLYEYINTSKQAKRFAHIHTQYFFSVKFILSSVCDGMEQKKK
jgi:hypothetical protein